jgi:cell division protein FtsL
MKHATENVDVRVETQSDDQKLRIGATVKTWIAIVVAVISIGIAIGSWSFQGRQFSKDITALQEKVGRMPNAEEIAKKEIVDLQLGNIRDSLGRIEKGLSDLNIKVDKQQEQVLKNIRDKK